MIVERLLRYVWGFFTLNGKLAGEAVMHRAVSFAVFFLGTFFTLAAASLLLEEFIVIAAIGFACVLFSCFYMLSRMCLISQAIPQKEMLCVLCVVCVGFALTDLYFRLRGLSAWPLFVIVIDLALVLDLDRRFALFVVGIVLFWLVLTGAEAAFRFGLYDIPGMPGDASRQRHWARDGECEVLPCEKSKLLVAGDVVCAISVFSIDFLCTRGFADALRREKVRMQKTIDTVIEATSGLVRYDVEGVEVTLRDHEVDLPDDIAASLRTLLEHLEAYRPYLPLSLVEADAVSLRHSSGVPGSGGEAAIVFSDIVSSTQLWECLPDAMNAALRTHNHLIRTAIDEWQGYEVKTIGDSFMVAFDSALDATEFSLMVQSLLVAAEWSQDLLAHPLCAEVREGGVNLWRGLTVRIGVNHGQTTRDQQRSGCVDFFGHTVNVASRLERVCPPGAVCLCESVWGLICNEVSIKTVSTSGKVSLKGVDGVTSAVFVWPYALRRRESRGLASQACIKVPLVAKKQSVMCKSGIGTMCMLSLPVQCQTTAKCASELNSAVSLVAMEADRSNGAVMCMAGDVLCVAWNTFARENTMHVESSLLCVKAACTSLRFPAAFGVATGNIHHAGVGPARQKFATTFGATARSSRLLMHAAEEICMSCLYLPMGSKDEEGEEGNLVSTYAHAWLSRSTVSVQGVTGHIYEIADGSFSEESLDKGSVVSFNAD